MNTSFKIGAINGIGFSSYAWAFILGIAFSSILVFLVLGIVGSLFLQWGDLLERQNEYELWTDSEPVWWEEQDRELTELENRAEIEDYKRNGYI